MTSGPFSPTFPGLGHDPQAAQNIEDFEAQMAAAKALLPGEEPPPYSAGNDDSNASGPSSQPLSSAVANNANSSSNNNPPQLQAGRVWSSESVVSFNNMCLKNAVANAFEYDQVQDSPQPGWAVRLTFSFFSGAIGGGDDKDGDGNSFVVSLPGPYGSKKEAKAAAAEHGLQVLLEAIERRGAAGKRKLPSGAGEGGEVRDAAAQGGPWDGEDEEENWVGLLGEYCQAEGKPRPMFQEFSLGANYSMECIMPPENGPVPDGAPPQPQAFGGRNILFNSKKAAKTNAAREAVRWLRATDRMPKKGHPTKKKMKAAQMMVATAAFPAPTGNTNPIPLPIPMPISAAAGGDQQGTNTGAASGSDSEGGSSSSSAGAPGLKDRSLGEQVMILCSKLGCAQPIYKILPDPRVPSMWSGAAYFPHDPAVGSTQPVGEVRNVYGKKKAREEVAKKVLKHLKAMQAQRQKVYEGVLAGATAGGGAAGMGGAASTTTGASA